MKKKFKIGDRYQWTSTEPQGLLWDVVEFITPHNILVLSGHQQGIIKNSDIVSEYIKHYTYLGNFNDW